MNPALKEPVKSFFQAYTLMCKTLEQREKKEAKGRSRWG